MEFDLGRVMEILERTPKVLRCLLEGLSEPWLSANEGPDTFSPHDVLGHLVTGEEADWIPRAKIILEHGEAKAFEPFDRFAFRKKYSDQSTRELLGRFDDLRARNLEHLRRLRLGPDELERRGLHPELGSVTLAELIATWAVHDLGHLAQIARVLSKQYEHVVGPWKSYISILAWSGSRST